MENLLLAELLEKWELLYPLDEIKHQIIEGGVEIECELNKGLSLNHYLKIATRILLRIKTQKCRDFPKLFKIIQKIDWKKYTKREDVLFKVTSKESRLIHTGKIKKTCEDALLKYFNANKLSQKIREEKETYAVQNIFIRIDNDELMISLDTSGEALYEREINKFKGHAPLRASIAAGIIKSVIKYSNPSLNIVDPMCGSGTFLSEINNFYKLNNRRKYSYQDLFKINDLKEIHKEFKFNELYGLDIDPEIIKNLNIKNKQVADIFKEKQSIENAFIICNPPYGKRVKLDRERQKYFQDLIKAIEINYRPKFISLLVPEDIKIKNYKEKLRVFNSGIWTVNYLIAY